MLHTDKRLRGMTLIEVIIGMAVIILVIMIAYAGVSASAGLMQHGVDLRNAEGEAVKDIEKNIKAYNGGQAVTQVPYNVYIGSCNESGVVSYDAETTFRGKVSAVMITGKSDSEDADVEYHYYMPPVTPVTSAP